MHRLLCKMGVHCFKFNFEEYKPNPRWLIRKWHCVVCGKIGHKLNELELKKYIDVAIDNPQQNNILKHDD